MMSQGFTIAGSSLSLLKPGERGVVTRICGNDDLVTQKLRAMNVQIGTMITVEQRSPRFIVRIGADRVALSDPTRQAIYVRLQR